MLNWWCITWPVGFERLRMYFLEISLLKGDIRSMILRIATPCSLIDGTNFLDGPAASIFSVDSKKMVTTGSSVTFLPPGGTIQHDNWGRQENLRPYLYLHFLLFKKLLVTPRWGCLWKSWRLLAFSQGCLHVIGTASSLYGIHKNLFRTCSDRPCGPPTLLYNGYRVFPGGKAAGAWRLPPTPI